MYVPGQDLGGLSADLGGVPLGRVDASGVAWSLQNLEGWDSAEVRNQLTQREADHGAWMGPTYFGERPITLTGTITAPDRVSLDAAREQLLAAVGLTDTLLTVYESIPKQALVRRSGKPVLPWVTDRIATYSLLVTAPDPRRYGAALQSGTAALPSTTGGVTLPVTLPVTISATTVSGQIAAENEGSVATRPVFTITGPVSQPQVAVLYSDGTVRMLTYSQDLAAGEVLVIDTDAHTVVLGGTASRRRYLSGQWPEIPAGDTAFFQYRAAAYNSTTTLTAAWRSAWM